MLPKFGKRLSQINIYKNYSYVVLVGLVTKSCSILATPWTIASQAPLSMGFSRQEYWSGLPFPSPGDLSYPRIEPRSLTLQAEFLLTELQRESLITPIVFTKKFYTSYIY